MNSYVLMYIRNQNNCKDKTLLLSNAVRIHFDLIFIINIIFHKFITN